MATPGYTETGLAQLETALARGITEVSYDDRTVRYGSLDEMRRLRREMRRELGLDRHGQTRKSLLALKGAAR